MIRNAKWCLVALSSLGLFGFADNGCFGDEPSTSERPSGQGCYLLDEEACLSDSSCSAIYDQVQVDCACAPCREGYDCGCDCGTAPTSFNHCQPRQVECGPICDIWCENGNVIDENGCPTCACNPNPTPCEGLDERSCVSTPGCLPIYEGSGGGCACPGCDMNGECPPCDCQKDDPSQPQPNDGFAGCVTDDPCASLSEEACVNTPGCFAEYGGGGACPPCTPDGICPGCAEFQGFLGCHTDWSGPDCWSDADCGPGARCEYGMGSGGAGGGTGDCACACDPDGFCGPCDCGGAPAPAPGGKCVPAAPECWSDADCGPGFICSSAYGEPGPDNCDCACDPNGLPCDCNCVAPAPAGSVCVPVGTGCMSDQECGSGGHCWDGACYYDPACSSDVDCQGGSCWDGLCVYEYCSSDAECPGGYCSYVAGDCGGTGGADCGAMVAGSCIYPSCDDGAPTLCDMMPPPCPEGQITAARNGCYECVDARSCEPVDPPVCDQVITYAADPDSGACFAFSTPCDVPAGWGPCAR